MSPQLRKACLNRSPYNPFQTDVFALGGSALHLATLTSPEEVLKAEDLDEAVGLQVHSLPGSYLLKTLLRRMLASEERLRPSMEEVCRLLAAQSPLPVLRLEGPVSVPASSQIVEIAKSKSPALSHIPPIDSQVSKLVHVTETRLHFFDCETTKWAQVALLTPIQVDIYSSWVVLEDGRVFCSGGSKDQTGGLKQAYVLGQEGRVQILPPMLSARKQHGVIEVSINYSIYIIGGSKS